MIEREAHLQTARALKELPLRTRIKHRPRIETPKPGTKRLGFLGNEAVIDRLEVSFRTGGRESSVVSQMINAALAEAGVTKIDKGKGGTEVDAVLQYEGTNSGPRGRKVLTFGPFGANILHASMTLGRDMPRPEATTV